ncbi:glycosyltransferase family 2 protein [Tenacibaculum sp. 190524A02b]|uniref:glycosyltransferase family 2 protein n=1 Tax=Tenacibaculum vairaonense TaxID=3137860 RepID=UPI0031FA9969
MTKLTVIIPTLNEESNIQRALDSVFFADEIIVIDSYSSDKTVEIVKRNKVKLLQRHFDDFSSQKNYAIQKATNEWVLVLDADEEISKELQKSIKQKLSQKTKHDAFYIYRKNYINNKKLNFGGYTNKIIRLFKKEKSYYEGIVHEKVVTNGDLGVLKGVINHYTFNSFHQFKKKIEHYAKLRAIELDQKGKKINAFHLYIKPVARFFIHYVLKLGFLDGKSGFIFSYFMGYGVYRRFQELTLLRNEGSEGRL